MSNSVRAMRKIKQSSGWVGGSFYGVGRAGAWRANS